MTITQTVDIPADRRIFLDLPQELPIGRAKVNLSIIPENLMYKENVPSLASLRGIDKGLDTMDAYFARKQADKEKEDAQFERMRKQ